jgi:hypothetical protein
VMERTGRSVSVAAGAAIRVRVSVSAVIAGMYRKTGLRSVLFRGWTLAVGRTHAAPKNTAAAGTRRPGATASIRSGADGVGSREGATSPLTKLG